MTVTIENLYTGNGSTTNYSFTFPYLDEPDIKASLDGVVTTNFRLLNATTVQFVNNTTANTPTAPGNGVAIRIYRETAYENPKATFYPGAAIRAGDLNDNTLQNLYVNQESNDKVADAWLRGDQTVISSESWHTSDDTKVASTKAIENRINSQIDTALTGDVVAGSSITIADNTPSAGKITVSVDAASGSATGSMSSSDFTKLQGIESNATADQTDAEIRTAVENATDSNVFTDADHSKLNGIEASATADQTDSEIKTAYENNSNTNAYTDAEKTKLSGIEASATADQTDAEIRTAVENATDSNVFTDADHTKLNGIEANATADQTAAEIKTAYESNAQTNPLTDAEKAVIDGVTANTSELNKLDGVTATTANLNIVSGKTFRASGDGTLTTTSDTEIPSSKVIASHVASAVSNVGGFVTIANEVSFPTTANQPANGVIVSISDAAGTVVNGSGVSTTGRTTDGTPATVTINNFPSSLHSETLASGVALLVTSTGSSNTYNYHKILAAETDVKSLSDDINDFNARYRVASSAPGSNNDDGDLWFDTAANKMKVYNATGSSWDDVASVGQFFINTISSSSGTGGGSATFNGSAYRFTLSNPATGGASQLLVSVNGVLQKPNGGSSQPSEGFAIDGNDIIFSTAPASGSDYFIITQGSSVSIGTPSANSVNSSHIIDGSIVNADISNSAAIASTKLAEIPGSKLADDSIAEVKLDVHNSPATDKYLKYTSNGMEWADGASEGTDVKSTGESGTTKFLRTDGDGTSSWQVPPDTVYTHPNHSGEVTSSADGAQTIASNVVDEDNLKVSNSPTNGYFLQAQSGNTGGLTWAEVSAAPEITGTASGTITADKPCLIKSDGTIDQVEATVTEQTPAGVVNVPGNDAKEGDVFFSGTAQNGTSIAYDEDNNTFLMGARINNNVYVKLGYYAVASSTDISWGTLLSAGGGYDSGICYDPTKECYATFWQTNSSTASVKLYKYNSTKTDVTNSATGTLPSGYDGGYPSIMYHTGIQKPVITFVESAKVYVAILHINSDATSVTVGTPFRVAANASNSQYQPQMFEDTTRSGRIYVGSRYDHDDHFWMHNLTIPSSGDSFTRNSVVKVVDGASSSDRVTNFVAIRYDPEAGKALMVYREGSNATKGIVLTPSDSSCSVGSKVGLISSSDTDRAEYMALVYDQGLKKLVLVWQKLVDDEKVKAAVLTISGTSVSMGTKSSVLSNGSTSVGTTHGGSNHNGTYNTKLGQILWVGVDVGNNTWARVWNLQCHTSVTNLTAENFVGFPKATYTNGQTATIKVVGNTSTQSSLTPGQKYYVQKDGTVKSSADTISVEAGLAISSTKLLIR